MKGQRRCRSCGDAGHNRTTCQKLREAREKFGPLINRVPPLPAITVVDLNLTAWEAAGAAEAKFERAHGWQYYPDLGQRLSERIREEYIAAVLAQTRGQA